MDSVWAVVVTHNRSAMLRRCLDALAAQRRPPDRILVVDNASTDDTREVLGREYPDAQVLGLPTNQGGAGGFYEGIKFAHAADAEWLWLMDDDTIPTADALTELLDAAADLGGTAPPAVLASRVIWRDGSLHPMNYPILERRRMDHVVDSVKHGVMPLRGATFVSLLLHRQAIDRHRLPLKHFFLWADDIEYTSRLVLGGERAYFVPASVVLHDTARAEDFRAAQPDRFYYHVRNTLLMARLKQRPRRDRLLRMWIVASTSVAYILERRSSASVVAVARALRDGVRRVPGEPG